MGGGDRLFQVLGIKEEATHVQLLAFSPILASKGYVLGMVSQDRIPHHRIHCHPKRGTAQRVPTGLGAASGGFFHVQANAWPSASTMAGCTQPRLLHMLTSEYIWNQPDFMAISPSPGGLWNSRQTATGRTQEGGGRESLLRVFKSLL